MSDISPSALSATPRPGKVFDKDVTFHPLTIGDILEWDAFAQGQFRRGARFGMTDGTKEEQLAYRLEANEEAKKICFSSRPAQEIEWSMTGMLYLCWLSLRHGNPKMTLDDAGKILGWGSQRLGDVKQALDLAKITIHVATGLVAEEVLMELTKPKKNESPTMPEKPISPTPDIGDKSTVTSGLNTNVTQPG